MQGCSGIYSLDDSVYLSNSSLSMSFSASIFKHFSTILSYFKSGLIMFTAKVCAGGDVKNYLNILLKSSFRIKSLTV